MGSTGLLRRFAFLSNYREVWLSGLLFMILGLIIIPMPTWLLDGLIALNLTMAVIIVLTSMYITRALDFSVFPAMLLITTLLRLALEIATTRLILGNTADNWHEAGGAAGGDAAVQAALESAGHVVKAFGEFVVGGDPVLGIIMFIIITVVQFIVVAQGAGRVSEVAARFTLDAMPGKQMAIDAELNARVLTPEEAKIKRSDLEAESAFFGAMDGAMKFVKGDAIAGIIIIIVNIVGGFIIGGLLGGMELATAASTFTLLTVGDGLVSQIPALLISISAGLVVTRAASPRNMGSELGKQMLQSPRALGISAGIVGLLGIVPGMPTVPLGGLALILGFVAYKLGKKAKELDEIDPDLGGDAPQDEINQSMLRVDPISLEVGMDLEALADPDGPSQGQLLERLKHVRRRIAMEFGVIAPGVRVRPHNGLEPDAYQVRIKGDLVAEGRVMVSHYLGIGQNTDVPGLDGEPTTDPIYGTPAIWVPASQQDAALQAGLQVFDAQDVVSTHVAEIIKSNLAELLTREEVAELLNMARQDAPTVVAELVPNLLGLGQIRQVLQSLVQEQVPIKDLPTILNALADQSYMTKNVGELTEFVRQALGRKICQRYQTNDGQLRAFILSPQAEQMIQGASNIDHAGQVRITLDPQTNANLQAALTDALQHHRGQILDPVIICTPQIRRIVKKLFERNFKKLVVLSFAEIVNGVEVHSLATLNTDGTATYR